MHTNRNQKNLSTNNFTWLTGPASNDIESWKTRTCPWTDIPHPQIKHVKSSWWYWGAFMDSFSTFAKKKIKNKNPMQRLNLQNCKYTLEKLFS